MRISDSNFQKSILLKIIGGIVTIIICLVTHFLTRENDKLASREITETRNRDGSVTKREMEIYK